MENLVISTNLIVLAVTILASTIFITRQQHVRLIETFGRFSSIRSVRLPNLPLAHRSAAK